MHIYGMAIAAGEQDEILDAPRGIGGLPIIGAKAEEKTALLPTPHSIIVERAGARRMLNCDDP